MQNVSWNEDFYCSETKYFKNAVVQKWVYK